ncbi:MAG: triosephosphate isomerase [Acidimicrobiales bacterium]|nr:MAG: triosephosphate isomerase [Acidimicrobiales bacterium]
MSKNGSRRPLIAGNWKMHCTHLDAIQLTQRISYGLQPSDYEKVDVCVHPPFTALRSVQTVLDADRIPMALGAQNCHWEEKGAFTGEVSPPMLAKLGVTYVIVGHSERRQIFGETDEIVAKKAQAVRSGGMTPIVCVGETLEERESGSAETVVRSQLEGSVGPLGKESAAACVIAYEPIWAIGTGKNASGRDAQEMAALIRSWFEEFAGAPAAGSVRILYGGSVKAWNARELLAQPDVDGALVGGASLDADEFCRIVQAAVELASR